MVVVVSYVVINWEMGYRSHVDSEMRMLNMDTFVSIILLSKLASMGYLLDQNNNKTINEKT